VGRQCPISGRHGVYTSSRTGETAVATPVGVSVDTDLVTRAQAGDPDAFAELVEGHRRELELHCYRVLGTAQDAEDAVQETFLAAWQHIAGFEARSSVRTWLYRIATNRCLVALRSLRRRQPAGVAAPAGPYPQPNATSEVIWLEPYPDLLLEGIEDAAPGPDARVEAREAISLAFVAALQLLPPRQRAVLVLRDVLGFRAKEVAAMLDTGEESVNSALKHARANLHRRLPPPADPPPAPNSQAERAIIELLATAYEAGDVAALVSLLTEDAVITTPLAGGAYVGPAAAARVFETIFAQDRCYRLIGTRANRQPAFGVYVRDPATGMFHANGMLVVTLAGDRIRAMTRFDNSVIARFGLPEGSPKSGGPGADACQPHHRAFCARACA
jgi:RNA polymerase sigma-70 factor (TIGR02960 family)